MILPFYNHRPNLDCTLFPSGSTSGYLKQLLLASLKAKDESKGTQSKITTFTMGIEFKVILLEYYDVSKSMQNLPVDPF